MSATPFKIHISQTVLDDLHSRLVHTRFPSDPGGMPWSHGTDLSYMKDLVRYWAHDYDWRRAEKHINSFAHFKSTIDDAEIHFIHERCTNAHAPVIILTHGWPDNFYRYHKILPMLKEKYHVIVPSLPGYGFSAHKAMNSKDIADIWAKLIRELGYESCLAVGGDTGAPVTMELACRHPDLTKAIYLTDVGWGENNADPDTLTPAEKQFQEETAGWFWQEGAYTMMHATKPLTVAYGLNDSPAGLAAWAASFANRGRDYNFVDETFGGRDDFLTIMTLYWATETSGSAMQMYKEEAAANSAAAWGEPPKGPEKCDVPVAMTMYPADAQVPKEWGERQGLNVQRYQKADRGGHFAALEVPELFAKDVDDAFAELLHI